MWLGNLRYLPVPVHSDEFLTYRYHTSSLHVELRNFEPSSTRGTCMLQKATEPDSSYRTPVQVYR